MFTFERDQVSTLGERLAEEPHRLITLFGPRQTGKTTIVRQALARSGIRQRYLAVDEPTDPKTRFGDPGSAFIPLRKRDAAWLEERWEEARAEAARYGRFVLVFDEIQKISNWSETVKGLWDADRADGCPLHVVLLGSAPLLMQSGLTESLAGRFEPVRVSHWTFLEMVNGFGFDLRKHLYFGAYPGAARYLHDAARWRDYVAQSIIEPSIGRDILAMARVDKPALLRNLFGLGTEYSGQILSYNKMLGQLHDAGNTTTLARYLHLLGETGLVTGIPKYSGKPHLIRASSPKLCVRNTALMTVGSGYSLEEAVADRTFWGRIVESAVGAHLLNTATTDIRVHYWREGALEVDFVLRRGPRVMAIEVKSGPRRGRLSGLEAFRSRFDPYRTLVVGEGGVPLSEFFSVPAAHWFDRQ